MYGVTVYTTRHLLGTLPEHLCIGSAWLVAETPTMSRETAVSNAEAGGDHDYESLLHDLHRLRVHQYMISRAKTVIEYVIIRVEVFEGSNVSDKAN